MSWSGQNEWSIVIALVPLFRVVLKPPLTTERRSAQFAACCHDIDLEIPLLGLIALGKRYSRNITWVLSLPLTIR